MNDHVQKIMGKRKEKLSENKVRNVRKIRVETELDDHWISSWISSRIVSVYFPN